MRREYYSDSIENFLITSQDEILGKLVAANQFSLEQTQTIAWQEEINVLKNTLLDRRGHIYFEYSIPRMGQRIDVVVLTGPVIFILEFKVGESKFNSYGIDQVWDYALDLKNFHEPSHMLFIAPILIATKAKAIEFSVSTTPQSNKLLFPIRANIEMLNDVIDSVLKFAEGENIDINLWQNGRYCPTPTIIEAAMVLYSEHSVKNISRSDAAAINLSQTSDAISGIIHASKKNSQKSICFVTGVPGAGKTLVGLNVATTHIDKDNDLYSVFLSGNGPLVSILREALARDKIRREKVKGKRIKKGEALSDVKMFIQNIHHFRDECLVKTDFPPLEHVALFDEAQRAWDKEQTSSFMRRKKNLPGFNQSEPDFLISCMDRHHDWAVIVCLVGGGQEINTGEAGIGEWIESLNHAYPHWNIYISPQLTDSEYGTGEVLSVLANKEKVIYKEELHLSVSMRSFRAENVSLLIT